MNAAFAFLLDPLSHEFMRRGLLVAVILGAVCSLLSCFLVLKGWSLMGDAVSHAVLPGIVLAYVLAIPLAVGAFAAGLLCAVSVGYLRNHSRVKEDAVMAIVFSGLFALGLVLFVKVDSDQHINHILFGNILGVRWDDVLEMAFIAIPVIIVILAKRRDLMLFCFDPAHAQAIGLPLAWLRYGLLTLLALTIVAAMKAVGIILVVSMLIAPGAIGFLLTRRFDAMLAVAAAAAIGSSVVGTILSFHMDAATGPAIVVTQSLVFAVALTWRSIRARRRVTR